MGIFDKRKKKKFLKAKLYTDQQKEKIVEMYKELSDNLKHDEQIIDKVVKAGYLDAIQNHSSEKIKSLIDMYRKVKDTVKTKDLFEHLTPSQQKEFIDLFENWDLSKCYYEGIDREVADLIVDKLPGFLFDDKHFFRLGLKTEKASEIVRTQSEWIVTEKASQNNVDDSQKIENRDVINLLELGENVAYLNFSSVNPNVIQDFFSSMSIEEWNLLLKYKTLKSLEFLDNCPERKQIIETLTEDEVYNLFLKIPDIEKNQFYPQEFNKHLINKLSKNPMLINALKIDKKSYITNLPHFCKIELKCQNDKNYSIDNVDDVLNEIAGKKSYNITLNNREEENIIDNHKYNQSQNQSYCKDILKLEPGILMPNKVNVAHHAEDFVYLLENIRRLVESTGKQKLLDWFDNNFYSKKGLLVELPYIDQMKMLNLLKVLGSETVLKNVDENEIINFIENARFTHLKGKLSKEEIRDSNKVLLDLVSKAYGKEAGEIIANRPQLSSKDIPNFNIFDKRVIDEFGTNVLNGVIGFDSRVSIVMAMISQSEENLNLWKRYKKLVGNMFGDTISDLDKMSAGFIISKDLLKKTKIFSQQQSENFRLAVADKLATQGFDFCSLFFPKSIGELNDYKINRTKSYDDAIDALLDIVKNNPTNIDSYRNFEPTLKRCVFMKFFGTTGATLAEIKDIYDFTETEKLAFDTYIQYAKIVDCHINGNFNTLKSLFNIMDKSNLHFSPNLFEQLQAKADAKFTEKFESQTMSPERLEKQLLDESNAGKLSKREVKGVAVYDLKGIDFYGLVHVTTSAASTGKSITAESAYDDWTYREGGTSTISCSTIEPGRVNLFGGRPEFVLGFSGYKDSQYMTGSYCDAATDHDANKIHPNAYSTSNRFGLRDSTRRDKEFFKSNSPDKYRTSIKDVGGVHDEVIMWRYQTDLNKFDQSPNGRLMPTYVMCFDETNEDAIKVSKSFNIPLVCYHSGYYLTKEQKMQEDLDIERGEIPVELETNK